MKHVSLFEIRGLIAGLTVMALGGCASLERIAETTARGYAASAGTSNTAGSQSAPRGSKTELEYVTSGSDYKAYRVSKGFRFENRDVQEAYIFTEPVCLFFKGTAWVDYSQFSTDNFLTDESGNKCRILAVEQ